MILVAMAFDSSSRDGSIEAFAIIVHFNKIFDCDVDIQLEVLRLRDAHSFNVLDVVGFYIFKGASQKFGVFKRLFP
jgi:hypothetical protein